nr:TonB-dependent receptor [Pseudomonas sp. BF-R-01]
MCVARPQADRNRRVALNGNNLFDKRYYATIGTETFGNYYGDPRNFMVSVKASF